MRRGIWTREFSNLESSVGNRFRNEMFLYPRGFDAKIIQLSDGVPVEHDDRIQIYLHNVLMSALLAQETVDEP